jgi:hypothetical protein
MKSIEFEDTGYLTSVGSCSVNVSCFGTEVGKFNIEINKSQTFIKLWLTRDQLKDFSAKIDNLVQNRHVAGHQYLDIETPQPFQIIAANREYPSELDPEK